MSPARAAVIGEVPLVTLAGIAAGQGELTAFVDRNGNEYAYGRWLRETESLRTRLRAAVHPGATVVAYLPRATDADLAPILTAALSAGLWLVPVGRQSGDAQLRRICAETHAKLLIISGADDAALRLEPLDVAAGTAITPEAGADGGCIVYTSGSTGSPRGVRCSAGDVCSWMVGAGPPVRREGFLTQFGLDTIGGLRGFAGAFGACPVMRVGPLDVAGLARLVEDQRPASIALLPGGVQAIGRRGLAVSPAASNAVCHVTLSGARSSAYELGVVRRHFPAAAITDIYTSTEAGGASVTRSYAVGAELTPPDGAAGWPVGRPSPGTEMRIVDDGDRPLPDHEEGWVWLRRASGAARTYVADYEYGGAVLRSDGWVATGDRGVIHAGELFLCGRGAERMLVHGRPVSCDLVERTLVAHSDVAAASVVQSPDDRLLAFVVRVPGRERPAERQSRDLRAHVRDALGPDSTPSRAIFVDQLPLTAAGKVDRMSLAARARAEDVG